MSDDIPAWAMERAQELILSDWGVGVPVTSAPVRSFARYIAGKEEPPVDPFVECIKLILGGFEGERHAQEYASNLRKALAERGLEIRARGK